MMGAITRIWIGMSYPTERTPVTEVLETIADAVTSTLEPRLLSAVSDRCRLRHYSRRTERAYTGWVKRFIWFHGIRHPRTMGAAEVEQFLTHLAVAGEVAAGTQNQALSALLFLYKEVLGIDL